MGGTLPAWDSIAVFNSCVFTRGTSKLAGIAK